MPLAIKAESIGKRYQIGEAAMAYRSLRTTLSRALTHPFRRLRSMVRESESNTIWALKDVSFEVEQGEVVGIIGRNGSGKSTLLKILSRVTEPTEGRALLYGDVGSLLEVGTGFHPELTGRENVYLNGAILGLSRKEMSMRYDDIVEFAGVERFMDTPVKRYSSGMQVRLAFAVAAHLEPDILIVDEVLAVGDAEFQKKCIGRMDEVRAGGRTVVFVSHSMPVVLRLCPRAILMSKGQVVMDGKSSEVVHTYLETQSGTETRAAREWKSIEDAPGDGVARLKAVRVWSDGRVHDEVDIRQPVEIEVEYWHLTDDQAYRPFVTLRLINEVNVAMFVSSEVTYRDLLQRPRRRGIVHATCTIPGNFLADGRVFVRVVVSSLRPPVAHVFEEEIVTFDVVDSLGDGSVRGEWGGEWEGTVRPMLPWTVTDEPAILTDGTPGG